MQGRAHPQARRSQLAMDTPTVELVDCAASPRLLCAVSFRTSPSAAGVRPYPCWLPLMAVALSIVAQLCGSLRAADAQEPAFNFEIRQLTGENFAARHVYGACSECTLEQYEAVVPPAGNWEKAAARRLIPPEAAAVAPVVPAGLAPALDLVPDIPGDDFFYIARVLSGAPIAPVPGTGFVANALVRRATMFGWHAGDVVHEVTSPEGVRYVLMTIDYDYSETIDLTSLDALSGLGLPGGWSYAGRTLAHDFQAATNGIAEVLTQGNFATSQLIFPVTAVTGRSLGIIDRADATRSKITLRSKDPAIAVGPAGDANDPSCDAGSGGNLILFSPTTGARFYQALPCENWKARGSTLTPRRRTYLDRANANGPCRKVVLENGRLRVSCVGSLGTRGSDFDLRFGTAQGEVRARLSVGRGTYCTSFGGDVLADGSDGRRFSARNSPLSAACM